MDWEFLVFIQSGFFNSPPNSPIVLAWGLLFCCDHFSSTGSFHFEKKKSSVSGSKNDVKCCVNGWKILVDLYFLNSTIISLSYHWLLHTSFRDVSLCLNDRCYITGKQSFRYMYAILRCSSIIYGCIIHSKKKTMNDITCWMEISQRCISFCKCHYGLCEWRHNILRKMSMILDHMLPPDALAYEMRKIYLSISILM